MRKLLIALSLFASIALSLSTISFTVQANPLGEEIVITSDDTATYYEHKVNGIVVEVKVEPKVGPAYYLVPADGGGWIKQEESQILHPKWTIFEW